MRTRTAQLYTAPEMELIAFEEEDIMTWSSELPLPEQEPEANLRTV